MRLRSVDCWIDRWCFNGDDDESCCQALPTNTPVAVNQHQHGCIKGDKKTAALTKLHSVGLINSKVNQCRSTTTKAIAAQWQLQSHIGPSCCQARQDVVTALRSMRTELRMTPPLLLHGDARAAPATLASPPPPHGDASCTGPSWWLRIAAFISSRVGGFPSSGMVVWSLTLSRVGQWTGHSQTKCGGVQQPHGALRLEQWQQCQCLNPPKGDHGWVSDEQKNASQVAELFSRLSWGCQAWLPMLPALPAVCSAFICRHGQCIGIDVWRVASPDFFQAL